MDAKELLAVWKRVKADLREKVFTDAALELLLIESDLEGWCEDISAQIKRDSYTPTPIRICDVPKGNGAVRPGSIIAEQDRAVFTAIVNALRPKIVASCWGNQGVTDIGHKLLFASSDLWFESPYECWKDFSNLSVKLARNAAYEYVVCADIAGFYECISHELLYSKLRQLEILEEQLVALRAYLRAWFRTTNQGLPQGCSASDMLAKVFMLDIDNRLQQSGLKHLRYVDDIRIFCASKADAKKAIIRLTGLLRDMGLVLQTSKLEIITADVALSKFAGSRPIIQKIRNQQLHKGRIDEHVLQTIEGPYVRHALTVSYSPQVEPTALEILEECFDKLVSDNLSGFDKSLFHFLLNQLATQRSPYALESAFTILVEKPEETQYLLDYFVEVADYPTIEPLLLDVLASHESIYDYQVDQLLRYVLRKGRSPSQDLLKLVRGYVANNAAPAYLRKTSIQILGKFGNPADMEELVALSSSESVSTFLHVFPVALKALEKARRNGIFESWAKRSLLTRRACDHAKRGAARVGP